MCLLQLRIEIFITCLLRNIFCQDFNSSVESMDCHMKMGLSLSVLMEAGMFVG